MDKKLKLVGILDLVNRWGYTKQAIFRRMKLDKKFPKPIARINKNRIYVFDFDDILEYEKIRKGVFLGYGFKQYLEPNVGRTIASVPMQTYEEWVAMSDEEKEKHK